MKPLYLFLLLTVYFSCQKKQTKLDLIGHWHIFYPDSTFGSWDILDSIQIVQDKNTYWGYYPIAGYDHSNLNPADKDTIIIAHWSEYIQYLPYDYLGDTLFLSDNSYAIKVDTATCKLQEEFFGRLYIDIKLPSSDDIVFKEKVISERSLLSYIDIGKPKKHLKQYSSDTFLIQVNDTFIGYDQIVDYVEREQSKLPSEERDSITLAFSVDKRTPATMVDSIEQVINSSFPSIKIYYACLPGEKSYIKGHVFISLKNEFAKVPNTADAVLDFSVLPGGELTWSVGKGPERLFSPDNSLQTAGGRTKLQAIILGAKQTKHDLGMTFHFAKDITFQDYITAQTTIRELIEESIQKPLQ